MWKGVPAVCVCAVWKTTPLAPPLPRAGEPGDLLFSSLKKGDELLYKTNDVRVWSEKGAAACLPNLFIWLLSIGCPSAVHRLVVGIVSGVLI